MSHFGDLVKKLRKERGMTLDVVAKKVGSHKGYISGIENDKMNPPSVRIIKKYAKIFGQDPRALARLAWVDKAPAILREDAEDFLKWYQTTHGVSPKKVPPELPPTPTGSGAMPSS